jgi:hypothetical protein
MSFVGKLPFVRPFVGLLRMDWLLGLIGDVDVAKAQAEVQKLLRFKLRWCIKRNKKLFRL